MPAPSEPHATLTFRRIYERTGREALSETLLVDGQMAFSAVG